MNPLLFDTYEYQADTRIWQRPDFSGIAYSDGDDIENRIFNAVAQSTDVGLFSVELANHCIDWPSSYHLSPIRSNILRPFGEKLRGKKVLEIGAGCGAITRYLADIECEVFALEGSARRAKIARTRVRDADNVKIVCDSFAQFQCKEKFDVVTLIGVLEYAPKFIGGDNPVQSMLQRALELLSPSGILLIAIENQLGLKYFAGASEDHLGVPMYGIEGLYKAGEPETFGRRELEERLLSAGFRFAHFHLPFPDYKFPTSIISSAAQTCPSFDASALVTASAHKDVQLPRIKTMSPELAWPTVSSNGLIADLSNSFLVEAGCESSISDSRTMAWHYSLERRAAYRKETIFQLTDAGDIAVRAKGLHSGSTDKAPALVQNLTPSPYLAGESLQHKLVKLLAYHGWRLEQLGDLLRPYLAYLLARAVDQLPDASQQLSATLPGVMIDCLPQNIIVSPEGTLTAFDLEWEIESRVSVERVLFRAALATAGSISRISRCSDMHVETPFDLFQATLRALGLPDAGTEINDLLSQEIDFQQMVTGKPVDLGRFQEWYTTFRFPHDPMQRAYSIDTSELQRSLTTSTEKLEAAEKLVQTLQDQQERLNVEISSNIRQLATMTNSMETAQSQLDAIRGSTSWKILSPMRKLLSVVRR